MMIGTEVSNVINSNYCDVQISKVQVPNEKATNTQATIG